MQGMSSRGVAVYSSIVRVLARRNGRCLSTMGTGTGNEDHEAMINYMRQLYQKSESAKGAQNSLMSKLEQKVGDNRKGPRPSSRWTAGPAANTRDGDESSEKPDRGDRIYNSRTNDKRGGKSGAGKGGRPLRELTTRGAAWDGEGDSEDRPRKKRGGWSSGEESDADFDGDRDFGGDCLEDEEDQYASRERELTDVDKVFGKDGEAFRLKGGMEAETPMDEIDKQLLFNYDHFAEMVKKGDEEFDMDEFDAIDEFLADAFEESFKSGDGSFKHVVQSGRANRVRVTPPRSIAQLQAYCAPPRLFNSPNEGPAADLAAQAWGVIHKNYYYRDSEKYRLVEKIALLHVKLEDHLARRDAEEAAKQPHQRLPRLGMPSEAEHGEDSDSEYDERTGTGGGADYLDEVEMGGVDLIHRVGFREGSDYLDEETRLLQLAQGGVVTQDDKYVQGETDWSVQAVVDEDQL